MELDWGDDSTPEPTESAESENTPPADPTITPEPTTEATPETTPTPYWGGTVELPEIPLSDEDED